jgi:TRAP-type C4-dicarboxylate transport system permease small subunit
MDGLDRLSRSLARAGLWFGGALVLLAALVIGIDVLMRKFLAASIGGADELAGYALAIGTVWALAAALLDRAHIRIDSLYVLFPTALRIALDLVGLALFIGFFAMIAWHGAGVVAQSWTAGSRSQSALETPTVIPQAIWFVGLCLFLVAGALLFLRTLSAAMRGDAETAVRLAGTRSAEEEVQEEIQDIAARAAQEDRR